MNKNNEFQLALDHLARLFAKEMPYLKPIGLTVDAFGLEKIVTQFDMKPALIGNMMHNILHGGVASTVLDSVGGMVAIASAFHRLVDLSEESQLACLANIATIDLRIDYVRPGRGKHFIASAELIRAGNKIATVKSQLINDKEQLIAVGQGSYLIG